MVKSEEGSPFTYPSPFAIRPSPFTRGNQPHPPLEREIGVRPLDEDDRAIAESHEVHDVHEKPEEPGRVAREPQVAEDGDGAIAPDDGQFALVDVAVGTRRFSVEEAEEVPRGVRGLP